MRALFYKMFVLCVGCLACIHLAWAGAESAPNDWLPVFQAVELAGAEVVFDSGILQIKLHDGQWNRAELSPVNMLVEKIVKPIAPMSSTSNCTMPEEVLQRYSNEFGDAARVVYCESPERIWFARGGYCGEGDDDPKLNQGHLYSYFPKTGKVRKYPNFLSKCAAISGLARRNNSLVMSTVYVEEYGTPSPGEILIFDLAHLKAPPKRWAWSPSAVVSMSDYEKKCDCLWFATVDGIGRFTLHDEKWEQRYLDYEITPDNQFVFVLSEHKPADEKMWFGRFLYMHPIADLRGFIAAWSQSSVMQYPDMPESLRIGSELLSFYIDGIKAAQGGWADSVFAEFVSIVAAHKKLDRDGRVVATIQNLLQQPMSLPKRWSVISAAKLHQVLSTEKLEAQYVDDLLTDYFARPTPSYYSNTDAVSFCFEHPEHLPKLRDYYLAHQLTFDVEGYFLDRASSYRAWKGYEILTGAIKQGQQRYEQNSQFFRMCHEAISSRSEGDLLAILQARLKTDEQAIFTRKLRNTPNVSWIENNCVSASHDWIYGSESQIRQRVELLLDTSEKHNEFNAIILEILNAKFAMNSQSLGDWRHWWRSNPNWNNRVQW